MITAIAGGMTKAEQAERHHKLVDAAQQFEAMFLQQLLKATGVDGQDANANEEASAGSDTYKSFGTEAVAKAVAVAGGLGIARQVVRQVERVPSVLQKDGTALKYGADAPIQSLRDAR